MAADAGDQSIAPTTRASASDALASNAALIDSSGTVLCHGDEFARILRRSSLAGASLLSLSADQAGLAAALTAVHPSAPERLDRQVFVLPDGALLRCDVRLADRRNDGQTGALVCTLEPRPGTEPDVAHEAEVLLARTRRELVRTPSAEVAHAIDRALQEVSRLCGADWSSINLLDDEGNWEDALASWHAPGLLLGPGRLITSAVALHPLAVDWMERGSALALDLGRLARRVPALARFQEHTGAAQAYVVPVRWDDDAIGLLAMVRNHVDTWDTAATVVPSFIDIAGAAFLRARAEADTQRSEVRFRALVHRTQDVIVVHDRDLRVSFLNPSAHAVLGWEEHEVLGRRLLRFVHRDDWHQLRAVPPGEHRTWRVRARHRDGTWRWLEVITTNLSDDKSVNGYLTSGRDVSAGVAAEQTLRRSEAMHASLARLAARMVNAFGDDLDAAIELALVELGHIADDAGTALWQVRHDELVRTHGHGPTQSVPMHVVHEWLQRAAASTADVVADAAPERVLDLTALDAGTGPHTNGPHTHEHRRQAAAQGVDLLDDARSLLLPMRTRGELVGLVVIEDARHPIDGEALWVAHTIVELLAGALDRHRLDDELERRALHDPLTGLANRSLLSARLEEMRERARRDSHAMSVLFIDIDRFKAINDTLGHDAGDELLRVTAARLSDVCRIGDTVARFGGDEFVVLMAGDATEAERLARRLRDATRRPIPVGERMIELTASIGVVSRTAEQLDVRDGTLLVRQADIAMYRAKQAGRDQHAEFTADMETTTRARFELAADLREAMEAGGEGLVLAYQPVLDIASRRLVSVEALVRWQHPRLGLLGPTAFVDLAEEHGSIRPLGRWVLREALLQLGRWHADVHSGTQHTIGHRAGGGADVEMAVNVSARQLPDPDLLALLSSTLERGGLRADLVHLELTESMLAEREVRERLESLRALGVRLAIDDFGTGYSSLAYLRNLPADVLKIDRSFVRNVAEDHRDRALVKSVIGMAHDLGLTVVAEGVETVEQLDVLCELQCDRAQGYLISRPAPADALTPLVRGHIWTP